MATESEVFGSCAEEIDVAVEVESRVVWLCCAWKYLRFIVAGKVPQYLRWRREMLPGIGSRLGLVWGG